MNKIISTRILLIFGILAGILSPIVVTIQVITREGFNLAIHPLSMLSLGEFGWIQIGNFILTGILYLGFAKGLYNVISTRKIISFLISIYGFILILAGVFTVDPMLGFPLGTPDEMPESLSWHAQIHNFTFLFAFLSLIIAQFVVASYFFSVKQKGFAIFSYVIGVSTPTLILLSQIISSKMGYILFGTGLVVDLWVIVFALQLLKNKSTKRK